MYAQTIGWHFFSPDARTLPGYTGFGRFFRVRPTPVWEQRKFPESPFTLTLHTFPSGDQYLTFCGFMAQLLLWPLAVVADLVRS